MKLPSRPKRGRPVKTKSRLIHIAATIDFRGPDEDRLFFLFRDPPLSMLESVFSFLIANGKGIASDAVISEEHDILRRIGKGYWRKAVQLINPDFFLCDIESMKLLIESRLKRIHNCKIDWMPIDKFLNI